MRRFDNNRAKILWAIAIGVLAANTVRADVRLPRLVGDGMVLQRDSKIDLWGWADPGESVRIEFQGRQFTAKADHQRRWSVSIGPYAAGGPYEMSVAGKNVLTLRNIVIGDVWLASGQSNMEFPMQNDGEWRTGVNNAEREIAGASFPRIRLFRVHHKIALEPIEDVEAAAGWVAVTPETVAGFSAVAYLFGRELHQRYDIPVGLIESSWGGTVAEAWMSEGALSEFPEFQDSIEMLKGMDEKSAIAGHRQYLRQRSEWENLHGDEDRGRQNGDDLWATPDMDTSAWSTIDEPQTEAIEALNGFDGVVWFRKEVNLPERHAGQDLTIYFPGAYKEDTTFFNGEQIGATMEGGKPKAYRVPGRLVRAGRNVVTIRLKGAEGYVGLYGKAEGLSLQCGDQVLSLAGKWSYRAGPDMSGLPSPSLYSRFNSDPNRATLLFNGMIAPLTPYRIKGAIWYQGESNADRPAQYRTLFPALIRDWRQQWNHDFPFLFVQLAGFGPNEPEPADYEWAELREAQSMTLAVPGTGMATAVDIGDEDDIHPRNKQDVAHRLALAAAKVAYGENVVFSGPTYESIQIEGNRIRIRFANLGAGLKVKDKYGYVRGFEIAAADGRFHWAQARQDGQDIIVFSEAVKQPIAVRYSWSNTPDGNVYNQEDLPAIPFRTGWALGSRESQQQYERH